MLSLLAECRASLPATASACITPACYYLGTKQACLLLPLYVSRLPATAWVQSKPLYNGFKELKEGPEWARLSPSQKRVVELELRDFVLGGVALEVRGGLGGGELDLRDSVLGGPGSQLVPPGSI